VISWVDILRGRAKSSSMSDTRKSIECYFELARQQLPAGKPPGASFSTKRVFKAKDRIRWLSLSELIGLLLSEPISRGLIAKLGRLEDRPEWSEATYLTVYHTTKLSLT
jgi:hypothetical protein